MNRLNNLVCCVIFLLAATATPGHADKKEALNLIQRVVGRNDVPVKLDIRKSANTYFNHEVKNGTLHITASNEVALCHGFYDYMKQNRHGMYSWSGSSLQLPNRLQDSPARRVVSPVESHYYFNVVTYGYTMPFWDWVRWEQEIDWMALHGVDMPLALVGYEAIIARVWKRMGLTDSEINAYFTGPAHLPWMRMGNVCGIDPSLDDNWHNSQIQLQHKILDRMRSLGMKPICPGFPGFVPESMKRLFPDLQLVETHWGGAFHNWMISPQNKLFARMSSEFIHEWEKEFGRCDYYLVDSFNEMDIPFPDHGTKERYELVASYGEKVYEGIRRANPKATWVMQGWMFGYQRNIWDERTLKALVSKVPDDKMLLLDLAVDYNRNFWKSEVNWEFYHGFFGKKWVYSVIPNMGGKTGLTGILDFYANGHLDALNSTNRGKLTAIGAAPEGIENNEMIYEMMMDAGWSNSHTDVAQWTENYIANRYGKVTPKIKEAWTEIINTAYSYFTDHPRYNWQFRPSTMQKGSIPVTNRFMKALEGFINASDELADSKLYRADLAEMTAHYIGAKCEILVRLINQDYLSGDTTLAQFHRSRMETLMLGMDMILQQHPTLRLDRWVEFAKNAAGSERQREMFTRNAKRIVTVWGPPVDDYSARIWSGLVKDYYLQRWKHYYDAIDRNETFDFATWEREWVVNYKPTKPTVNADVVTLAKSMMALAKDISTDMLSTKPCEKEKEQ